MLGPCLPMCICMLIIHNSCKAVRGLDNRLFQGLTACTAKIVAST